MLLLPVGTALLQRGRLGARWTVVAMLVPFAVALGWVLARTTGSDGVARYPWSIEPIYCGLASSLLLYGAGWAVHSSRRRATLAAAPLEESGSHENTHRAHGAGAHRITRRGAGLHGHSGDG